VKGKVALVDRSLFSPNHESNDRGKIDCVYLDNVLGYPIIQGKSNSRYVRTSDLTDAPDRLDQTSSVSPNSANACRVTSNNEHVEAPPQALAHHVEKSGLQPQSKEGATLMQSAVLHAKRLRIEAITAAEVKNIIFGAQHRSRSRKVSANMATMKSSWDTDVSKVIAD
jgi:hypothetical protein